MVDIAVGNRCERRRRVEDVSNTVKKSKAEYVVLEILQVGDLAGVRSDK